MFQLGGRGADAGQAGFQLRRFAKYVRGKRFSGGTGQARHYLLIFVPVRGVEWVV